MTNSRNYTLSYLAFAIASSLQLLWIVISQLLPLDFKSQVEFGVPFTSFILLTGSGVSALFGILALKSEKLQLLWVIPQVLYLGIFAFLLISPLFHH